jgi:hypothetical protein
MIRIYPCDLKAWALDRGEGTAIETVDAFAVIGTFVASNGHILEATGRLVIREFGGTRVAFITPCG